MNAQSFSKPVAAGAPPQLVDDASTPTPSAASGSVDRERPHFGDVSAERRELGAADDLARLDRDHEPVRVDGQLAERPRQQVALFQVRRISA